MDALATFKQRRPQDAQEVYENDAISMTSKYDDLILLKETRSKTERTCSMCGKIIKSNELHYRETLTDSRINFIGKRFCAKCYAEGKNSKGPLDRF
jgi:hypothetical protein